LYTLDILRRWLDAGRINYDLYDAGRRFENVFRLACLGPRYAVGSLERVDKTTSNDGYDYTAKPRATIKQWVGRLGPCYEFLEMVLGHQLTFKQFAFRKNTQGRKRATNKSIARQFLKSLILLDIVVHDK